MKEKRKLQKLKGEQPEDEDHSRSDEEYSEVVIFDLWSYIYHPESDL